MRVSQKASPFGSRNGDKLGTSSTQKRYAGCGLSGSRRRKSDKLAVAGVTKSDIRRLARKAGGLATALLLTVVSQRTHYSSRGNVSPNCDTQVSRGLGWTLTQKLEQLSQAS